MLTGCGDRNMCADKAHQQQHKNLQFVQPKDCLGNIQVRETQRDIFFLGVLMWGLDYLESTSSRCRDGHIEASITEASG